MANVTTNLSLPVGTLGDIQFKRSFRNSMTLLDTTLGAIADVSVLDGAGGDPVVGDLADKLTAIEARLVVLETAP